MAARRIPRAGSLRRAVYDAMHARWCGPDCPPSCQAWSPDLAEQQAAIHAVQQYYDQRGGS